MPVVDGLPVPVVRWHVAPRKPAAGPPEHPVDHRPVIGPTTTPLRLLAGQQRFQPGPFLIGQIVTIEHADGLPHPPFKIRGTRSSGADAPARPDVWWGSGRIVRWHCVSRYEPPLAVGGLAACPTGAGDDATPHCSRCAVPSCGVRDRVDRPALPQPLRPRAAAGRAGRGLPDPPPRVRYRIHGADRTA